MKVTLAIWTRHGFYAQRDFTARNVKDAQDAAMKQLDKLPDEIDGAKVMDWTRIQIDITR